MKGWNAALIIVLIIMSLLQPLFVSNHLDDIQYQDMSNNNSLINFAHPITKGLSTRFNFHDKFLYNTTELIKGNTEGLVLMDTGIDSSLTQFLNRDIQFIDFIGASWDVDNDIYRDPSDRNGHGSFLGSIAIAEGGNAMLPYQSLHIDEQKKGSFTKSFWSGTGLLSVEFDLNIVLIFQLFKGDILISEGYTNQTLEMDVTTSEYTITLSGQDTNISMVISCPKDLNGADFSGLTNSPLIVLKIMDDEGIGTVDSVIAGLEWIITNHRHYNISVVNMAFAFDVIIPEIDSKINQILTLNINIVTGSGNGGMNTLTSPASSEGIIVVGAVDEENNKTAYSNYVPGIFFAPGGTSEYPVFAYAEDGEIRQGWGTSISSLLVSILISQLKHSYEVPAHAIENILLYSSYIHNNRTIINADAALGIFNPDKSRLVQGKIDFFSKSISIPTLVEKNTRVHLLYKGNNPVNLSIFRIWPDSSLSLSWHVPGVTNLDEVLFYNNDANIVVVLNSDIPNTIFDLRFLTNFSPNVEVDDNLWDKNNMHLQFQSVSGIVNAYINSSSIGLVSSGMEIEVPPGIYNVTLEEVNNYIQDQNFGKSQAVSYTHIIDNTSPEFQFSSLSNLNQIGDEIILNTTASDNIGLDRIMVQIDGVIVSDEEFSDQIEFNPHFYTFGTKEMCIVILDSAGNNASICKIVIFSHELYVLINPDEISYHEIYDLGFTGHSEYPGIITYIHNGNEEIILWDGDNTTRTILLLLGTNNISITISVVGISFSYYFSVFFRDVTPPIIKINSFPLDANYEIEIVITIHDYSLQDVVIFIFGRYYSFLNDSIIIIRGDPGIEYLILVFAVDGTGNNRLYYRNHILFDHDSPIIIMTDIQNDQLIKSYKTDLIIRWDVEENFLSMIIVTLDNISFPYTIDSGFYSVIIRTLSTGTHILNITAIDNSGNESYHMLLIFMEQNSIISKDENWYISTELIRIIAFLAISILLIKRWKLQ